MLFQTTLLSKISSSYIDYPKSDDVSLVSFFVGCDFSCDGCQNPQLQDYNYSEGDTSNYDIESFTTAIEEASKRYNNTRLFTLEGGDPFATKNLPFLIEFLEENEYRDNPFKLCIYTGYTMEEVLVKLKSVKYNQIQYYITGQYDQNVKQVSEKTDTYFKLASSNQKIYDTNYKLLSKEGVFEYE